MAKVIMETRRRRAIQRSHAIEAGVMPDADPEAARMALIGEEVSASVAIGQLGVDASGAASDVAPAS